MSDNINPTPKPNPQKIGESMIHYKIWIVCEKGYKEFQQHFFGTQEEAQKLADKLAQKMTKAFFPFENYTGKIEAKETGEMSMILQYPKLYELFTEYVGKSKATSIRFESFMDDYTDRSDFIDNDYRSVLEKHGNNEEAIVSIEKFILSIFVEAGVVSAPYYRPFGDDECEKEYGSHLLTVNYTPAFITFFTEKFEERDDFESFLEKHKLILFGFDAYGVEYDIIDKLNEGADAYLDWHGIYANQHTPLWSCLDCFWGLLTEFEEWKMQDFWQEKACGCPIADEDCFCNGNPF